jgi:hypothetical protein
MELPMQLILGTQELMPERYQKEIEEILRQSGGVGSSDKSKGRRDGILRFIWVQIIEPLGNRGRVISPGRVMLVAICLLVVALFLGSGTPGFTGLLGWMGLVLFIVGYGMFFLRPRSSVDKRWRGRPVEDEESLWDRLRRRSPRN